jgi:hypothetical protein
MILAFNTNMDPHYYISITRECIYRDNLMMAQKHGPKYVAVTNKTNLKN